MVRGRAGRTWARLALALAPVVALAACDGAHTRPASPASPAARFTSADYSTAIPAGWTDQTDNETVVASVSVNGTVLMLLIAPSAYTDRENEHIDVSLAQPTIPPDQLSAYLESAARGGATQVSSVKHFTLDGTGGLYVTYDLRADGSTNRAQDMVVDRDGSTFEIVLNTSATDFGQQLPALAEVIRTWRWLPS